MVISNDSNMRIKNTSDKVSSLSSETLIEVLEAAYSLRRAIEGGKDASNMIKEQEPIMIMLLEYLILNMDNPNIDKGIFAFLEQIFGEKLKKLKHYKDEKYKIDGQEEGVEDELTKEEKQIRLRAAIYEIYKLTNPNRLAGETAMENFIKNVKTRGVEFAMKYDGHEMESKFTKTELKNLSSYSDLVKKNIHDGGSRGAGL